MQKGWWLLKKENYRGCEEIGINQEMIDVLDSLSKEQSEINLMKERRLRQVLSKLKGVYYQNGDILLLWSRLYRRNRIHMLQQNKSDILICPSSQDRLAKADKINYQPESNFCPQCCSELKRKKTCLNSGWTDSDLTDEVLEELWRQCSNRGGEMINGKDNS